MWTYASGLDRNHRFHAPRAGKASDSRYLEKAWVLHGFAGYARQAAFGIPVFVWMQDFGQLSTLLSDLQRREKAFDKKAGA